MRLPLNIYPRLSPNVPAYQDVRGTGSVSASMASGQSSFTEHWFIKDTDLQQFTQDVLGWSKKNGVRINRNTPAQHADLNFMWASRVTSVEGYASTGKRAAAAGSVASFKLLRIGVQYDTPPYRIVDDVAFAGDKEYKRYVVPTSETNAEFLQLAKGAFVFYGGAPAPNANKTFGRPGESGALQIVMKTKVTYLWIQVPDNGLFSMGGFDQGGRPYNIENALGTVNNDTWHSYPKGTLLLESYGLTPQTLPIAPATVGLPPRGIPRVWNVALNFVYFDPLPFDANFRGHNLVPLPGSNSWVLAKRQGAADGDETQRIYQYSNFDTIFEMI